MVWREFEKILMYRSMMSQFSRIIHSIAYTLMGQLVWQQSEAYIATGEPENNALALKVQKPAQVAYNLFIVGRFILFLLQLKWHNLSKFNFYYELIVVVFEQLFPIDITAASSIAMRMNDSVIRFLVDYFHWWPSLILSVA